MTVISVPDIAARAKAAFDTAQATLPAGQAADDARNEALSLIRRKLVESEPDVKAANAKDVAAAKEAVSAGKLSPQLLARLDLFVKNKWNDMLEGISSVAALESPLDKCLWAKRLAAPHRESGAGELDLYRLTCPIGVLLCIFEARPEVVVNIATLALKSGNAAILKGGKESTHTSTLLARLVSEALSESKLPADLIQSVESREQVAELLTEDKYVDLVIPRGSNELVRSIQRDARMPVMGHADGLCAAYVHSDAVEESTIKGVVDSKIDYPAACNAVETLLVHRSQLTKLWPALATALLDANVELRCDPESLEALDKVPGIAPRAQQVKVAVPGDFYTEFLDLKLAVKTVSTVQEAIEHINTHGSHHTDAIFCSPLASPSNPTTSAAAVNGHSSTQTQEHEAASQFTRAVSSANVFVNCSTRFADGFRFGLGTEVGISTGKTHARGPVGLEGLVIYKYVARASGSGPHTASSFSDRTRSFAHSALEQEYPAFDLPRPPAQTAPNNAAVNAAPHLTDSLSKSSSEPYLYSQDVHVAGYEPLIPPTLLLHETPLTEEARRTIARGRGEASAVISGKDDRLLVVVGPCSIHSPEEALDYAKRLKDAMPQWPRLVVVMRAYFEKPRTTVGWKGLINDPDINGSFQINRGLKIARQLLIELTSRGVPVACEVLDTISPQYTSDLYSWGAIGARTTESQLHRELVSGLSMPIGFKNGTDGGPQVALDAIRASAQPHAFMGVTAQGLAAIVRTTGNADLHIIHRGGGGKTNYDAAAIRKSADAMSAQGRQPSIMVDCSHGNSQKDHRKQALGVQAICEQLQAGERAITGVMIESNLGEGNQKMPANGDLSSLKRGVSLTDACIDWDTTVKLLQQLNEAVLARRKLSKASS